ncbi:phosphate/phosphite/phosphonate ABC transporter substrate-binding protein [Rhodoferax sp.]|uniref:substrate-binding domain-containing protein n=1 Tax=Rhodoferax sp. TaxID=50421 RepID=UPI002779944C|nr:phosphate/phosphite/phosphonate ABC transporter substrate-binding protein [Rhodoferax sp.]
MHRRELLPLLYGAATLPLLHSMDVVAATLGAEIRIGLTPVFLDDQLDFLKKLRGYLTNRLEVPVSFAQRGSYREIVELIRTEKIDLAWLCGYPYVRFKREMKLLAVPLYHGNPLYQSYLIVPASDTKTATLLDLGGKMFAYSDPDSNSGYLYPQYQLLRAGENPASFFSRTFFTWGHRKVIEAVGVGLAQGGAVDGYVWDMLASVHPELTAATRIVSRSPEMGYPPFVARAKIPDDVFRKLRNVLLSMRLDAEGARLLKILNLDGFIEGNDQLFDGIAVMARAVAKSRQ